MPNIKSAKKRVKVIAVKSAQNQANRSALKTQIKKRTSRSKPALPIRTRCCRGDQKDRSGCRQGSPAQEYRCKEKVRPLPRRSTPNAIRRACLIASVLRRLLASAFTIPMNRSHALSFPG